MSRKVELIPISEGNRILVKLNKKISIGRGSSLGCNDKKISRNHAELLLKNDETLWIKPVHTNPVFYRTANGKTVHLTKDLEQELKDGDHIGLLPTSFFFRISFSNDINNNKNELISSSDHDGNKNVKSTTSTIKSSDVEPKPCIQDIDASTLVSKNDQDEFESIDSNKKPRKLPAWILATTTTKTTPANNRVISKRSLSSEEDNNTNTNDLSNTSDTVITEPNKSSKMKSFDSDSTDGLDSTPSKKIKSSKKRRPACSYGATCYRKNPTHRNEQAHPGDSDYDDEEQQSNNDKKDDDDNSGQPLCPYGASCYRQNAQHKRDYRH